MAPALRSYHVLFVLEQPCLALSKPAGIRLPGVRFLDLIQLLRTRVKAVGKGTAVDPCGLTHAALPLPVPPVDAALF